MERSREATADGWQMAPTRASRWSPQNGQNANNSAILIQEAGAMKAERVVVPSASWRSLMGTPAIEMSRSVAISPALRRTRLSLRLEDLAEGLEVQRDSRSPNADEAEPNATRTNSGLRKCLSAEFAIPEVFWDRKASRINETRGGGWGGIPGFGSPEQSMRLQNRLCAALFRRPIDAQAASFSDYGSSQLTESQ